MEQVIQMLELTIQAIKDDSYDKEDILTDLENILADIEYFNHK